MDVHILDNVGEETHHEKGGKVPTYPTYYQFGCGLDDTCRIQGVKDDFPTFNYKQQRIPMPLSNSPDLVPRPTDYGADAAPYCKCSKSDKPGYPSDKGWIMCTFCCGDYPNTCPNPGKGGHT